jgi:hypothetical protein
MADSMGVAGMPHSKIVRMPIKLRCEGSQSPNPEAIAKEALRAWDWCYSVKPVRVVATYENFILWENI